LAWLLQHRNGENYTADFYPLTRADLQNMRKSEGWTRGLDWKYFLDKVDTQVYKLVVHGDDEIQGCIAFINDFNEFALVELIEKAPVNRKPNMQFSNIAAVMLAFASKSILDLGGLGYICFEPKTGLSKHYENTYNAKFYNPRLNLMTILEVDAKRLIGLYYIERSDNHA
jgi:hypothetical protein